MKTTISKKLFAILSIFVLSLALTACGSGEKKETSETAKGATASGKEESKEASQEDKGSEKKEENQKKPEEIKIGVVGENDEVWDDIAKRFQEGEGIKLKFVHFTEYSQPNEALASGDIDLNAFQHKIFLENYIKESGHKLTIIGDTQLAPLGIYSRKIKDVKELKEGDKIAIPNDPTNGARALFLLQTAGLIKVKGNPGELITVDDVTENSKKLEIISLDASQTARALDDVTASCINNGVATDAGFNPVKDSIFLEPVDENSKPYINIIVSRPEDKDNPYFNKLVKKYYQTPETKKIIDQTSKGSSIAAWEGVSK